MTEDLDNLMDLEPSDEELVAIEGEPKYNLEVELEIEEYWRDEYEGN